MSNHNGKVSWPLFTSHTCAHTYPHAHARTLRGTFTDKATGVPHRVAIKRQKVLTNRPPHLKCLEEDFVTEGYIHAGLDHPNVLKQVARNAFATATTTTTTRTIISRSGHARRVACVTSKHAGLALLSAKQSHPHDPACCPPKCHTQPTNQLSRSLRMYPSQYTHVRHAACT